MLGLCNSNSINHDSNDNSNDYLMEILMIIDTGDHTKAKAGEPIRPYKHIFFITNACIC